MNKLLLILAGALAYAQTPAPQPYLPTSEELQQIRTKMAPLARATDPDVAIYYKAADWILRHPEEFYTKAYFANTLAALETGLERLAAQRAGQSPWNQQKGRVARAYRSRVDGSVQPYIITVPESYDAAKPMRLDVVLHGRAATMNEVSFLAPKKTASDAPQYLVLEVFGRTNNAYRWAGETDVFEAMDAVRSHYNVDPNRIVLRGFSMGGAGAWHIGLQHPDQWVAAEAGAGFTETIAYAKLKNVPDYQRSAMHIYDAVDYAMNAVDVPFVGYGGEIDPQLRASVSIREALARENIPPADLRTLFLVGPQTAHKFHPDSKKQSDEFINTFVERGRQPPRHIRFVTYTTRFNECFGIRIDSLEHQYERAEIDAEGGQVQTKNVAEVSFVQPLRPVIDGQAMTEGTAFVKENGKWRPASGAPPLRKRHGLQGPIDDAFMDAFLCVRPPREFAREWAKWMRGDLRVKEAADVSNADMAANSLILFGDASDNKLIAKIAPKLPIHWSGKNIVVGDQQFSAADHTLAMIYPNPLNPHRYVVLNSGHTFHDADFKGTNALLYPRLGDYAIIRKSDGAVVLAGLFDDAWRLPATTRGTRSSAP